MTGSCGARRAGKQCLSTGSSESSKWKEGNREELRSNFPSLGFDPRCITCLCNKALKVCISVLCGLVRISLSYLFMILVSKAHLEHS